MRIACALALGFMIAAARAADWPQFLGPSRNGSAPDGFSLHWPDAGPTRVWKHELGQGFSGPIVSEGKVVIFHRVDDAELIQALDAATGSLLWTHSQPTGYKDDFGFDEGPRATPAAAGGKVACLGAEGRLTCLDIASGKRLWTRDLQREFSAGKGFFGVASSPLIHDGKVIVSIGGANGAGVAAFDSASGKPLWKSVRDEAGYASPLLGAYRGKPALFCLLRGGLHLLEPEDGKVLLTHRWRPAMSASVSAANPLLIGSRVFLTASYGAGAVMLELSGPAPAEIWSGQESLSAHYATPVEKAGYIYGFDGRQEYGPSLVCVNAADGKVAWRKEGLGAGSISIAGDSLLLLLEKGEALVLKANPLKYEETGRAQLLGGGVRAFPALADGAVFARDKKVLARFNLAK